MSEGLLMLLTIIGTLTAMWFVIIVPQVKRENAWKEEDFLRGGKWVCSNPVCDESLSVDAMNNRKEAGNYYCPKCKHQPLNTFGFVWSDEESECIHRREGDE